MTLSEVNRQDSVINLVTFKVGELLCALDINEVDEIKRSVKVTRVHRAPVYISGVINLRGRIVTVIDLCRKLDVESGEAGGRHNLIVVRKEMEQLGLLVDSIEDTVTAHLNDIEDPPSTVTDNLGRYLDGVYKTERTLMVILRREALVERSTENDVVDK